MERWAIIEEFPNYEISDQGQVYNRRTKRIMRSSINNFGHVKITLTNSDDNSRHDRSVAKLVADAFVLPPNDVCDTLIVLDGNFTNLCFDNLAWRPNSFAWKYTNQMKNRQPIYYHNLPIHNITTDLEYDNVVEAGVADGLLFDDVWRSTYTGYETFPHGFVFEVIKRV